MRRFALPLVILGSIALAALLTWIALSSANFGNRAPAPDGKTRTDTAVAQPMPPFTRIDVAGNADITLVQGSEESVVLAATGRKSERLVVEVDAGTLYLRARDRTNWWEDLLGSDHGRTPQVVVNFKELASIAAAGTVKITADSIKSPSLKIAGAGGTQIRIDDLQTDDLRLSGAGALRADLAGRATDQKVVISGAGDYRGAKLASQNATVTVAGAGKVVVKADKTLNATISGIGSVEYIGNPQVTQRIGGAGSVRRRDVSGEQERVALAREPY